MFVGIVKDDLMVRVGPPRYEEALKAAHTRPMDFTGKPMVGYIYVVDTPFFAKTDGQGRARIEGLPAGDFDVMVWHPAQAATLPARSITAASTTTVRRSPATAVLLRERPATRLHRARRTQRLSC